MAMVSVCREWGYQSCRSPQMMGGLGGSTLPLLVCGSFPAAAGGENGLFPFNVATEVACAGTLGRGQHTPAASETPPATPQCHCQCVRHDVVQQRGLQRTNEILLRRFLVRGREARVLAAGLPARGSWYFSVVVSPAWKDGWRRGLAVERGRASCPRGGIERHRAVLRDHRRQGSTRAST